MADFDRPGGEEAEFAGRVQRARAADPAGGMWLSDTEPSFIDTCALRRGRLAKLRHWMGEAGYGAVVLFDPYNQRYATGSRNMFGYFLGNSTRPGPIYPIAGRWRESCRSTTSSARRIAPISST